MYRGTTPVIEVNVTGIQLSELENIYVTLRQDMQEITKTNDEIIIEEGNIMHIPLTQEDTLKFDNGSVRVQMRATTKDGHAVASNIKKCLIEEILMEGVIR